MMTYTGLIESELKAQSFMEQADHERQVRLVQAQHPRPIFFETADQFLIACKAGWAAYRSSIEAARHNTI